MLQCFRVGWLLRHIILLGVVASLGQAQGSFVNLDFEDGSGSGELLSEVFPGWHFDPDFDTSYTALHLSSLPQRYLVHGGNGGAPLDGDNALMMAPTLADCLECAEDVGIQQTGLVPMGTESIRLLATPIDPLFIDDGGDSKAWRLFLGGVEIEFIDLDNAVFGANIPSFAGEIHQLRIEVDSTYYGNGTGEFLPEILFVESSFDNIQFSPLPVPEPNTALLLMCSTMLVACNRTCRFVGR